MRRRDGTSKIGHQVNGGEKERDDRMLSTGPEKIQLPCLPSRPHDEDILGLVRSTRTSDLCEHERKT